MEKQFMFSWLKRRQRKEYAMLFYQNDAALNYLQGYFQNDQNALTWVRSALEKNRKLAMETSGGQASLNVDQLDWLLRTNKEAHRMYDTTFGATAENFDKAHAPLEGWNAYFREQYRYES
jgi:hypothetical protein